MLVNQCKSRTGNIGRIDAETRSQTFCKYRFAGAQISSQKKNRPRRDFFADFVAEFKCLFRRFADKRCWFRHWVGLPLVYGFSLSPPIVKIASLKLLVMSVAINDRTPDFSAAIFPANPCR